MQSFPSPPSLVSPSPSMYADPQQESLPPSGLSTPLPHTISLSECGVDQPQVIYCVDDLNSIVVDNNTRGVDPVVSSSPSSPSSRDVSVSRPRRLSADKASQQRINNINNRSQFHTLSPSTSNNMFKNSTATVKQQVSNHSDSNSLTEGEHVDVGNAVPKLKGKGTQRKVKTVTPPPYVSLTSLFSQSNRVLVACEFADTERTYVAALHTLVTVFIDPLSKLAATERRAPLTQDQLNVLFSNAKLIHTLNDNFLCSITTRLTEWLKLNEAEHKIGDLIAQFAPYFKMYASYCSTFDASQKLLIELTTGNSSAFTSFLSSAEKNPQCKHQTLASLLIQPIQRVPRYKLLLEQLVKYTPGIHPDMSSLTAALAQISTVAHHINEAIRKRESMEAVIQIEEKFMSSPGFLHHSRYFIRQGLVSKITKNGQCKQEQFFLFNDLLASARTMMGKYILKHKINIDNTFTVSEYKPTGDESNNLPIEHSLIINYGANDCLHLCFIDCQEKSLWQVAFDKSIAQAATTIQASEKTAAVTGNGSNVTVSDVVASGKDREEEKELIPPSDRCCALCLTVFSLFNRKQICRTCSRSVCGDCSRSRLILNTEDKRPERICDGCAAGSNNSSTVAQPPSSPSSSARARGHHYSASNSYTATHFHMQEMTDNGSSTPTHHHSHTHIFTGGETTAFSKKLPFVLSPSSSNSSSLVPPPPPPPSSSSASSYPPMRQWDHATVLRWLCEPGVGFSPYLEAFRHYQVDGSMLMDLTDSELKDEIKVTEALNRKRLLKMIERLAHGPTLPASPLPPPIPVTAIQPAAATASPPPPPPPITYALEKVAWQTKHTNHNQSNALLRTAAASAAAATAINSKKLPDDLAKDIHTFDLQTQIKPRIRIQTDIITSNNNAAVLAGISPTMSPVSPTSAALAALNPSPPSSPSSSSVSAASGSVAPSSPSSSAPAMPKRAAPSLPSRQRNAAVCLPTSAVNRLSLVGNTADVTDISSPSNARMSASASIISSLDSPADRSHSNSGSRCTRCSRVNEFHVRFCSTCGTALITDRECTSHTQQPTFTEK